MKKVGITQRVEVVPHYLERRDCLDQRWSDFALALGFIPIPLPNLPTEAVNDMVEALALDAVILSGGNSLTLLGEAQDVAPERDGFELALITSAIERGLPVLGICRGMQMLNSYFGGELKTIEGHVAKDHVIIVNTNGIFTENDSTTSQDIKVRTVNSYHSWGITQQGLAEGLMPLAVDDQGYIEAFKHSQYSILAMMWHPERVSGFDLTDFEFIRTNLL
ncbi:type 1 glutamine amidotransferase [Vibrio sp. 10N.261.46.E11]|uniref:type 1 glutamine amidotransferase n=1 Tax=Vibrio sp. 10N.261.46.E11 TaxID=3229662 RepID=UPI003550A698